MKLTQLTVQLWLDDLAKRTQGKYTVDYSLTEEHTVTNKHGFVKFINNKHGKKWFRIELDGSKEITEAEEFTRILNEIDKE